MENEKIKNEYDFKNDKGNIDSTAYFEYLVNYVQLKHPDWFTYKEGYFVATPNCPYPQIGLFLENYNDDLKKFLESFNRVVSKNGW